MMKEGSKRYKALLDEAFQLHLNKNQGYSANNPDAFANFRLAEGMGLTPVQGVLVRLGDKFARVQSLMKDADNDKVGESIRDTLMDLSAYALIAICLMEEEEGEEVFVPTTIENDTFAPRVRDALGVIRCFNRDASGNCLGHPVKNGPLFHDPENPPKNFGEEIEEVGRRPESMGATVEVHCNNPSCPACSSSCCKPDCSMCGPWNTPVFAHIMQCNLVCDGCLIRGTPDADAPAIPS